MPRSSSENRKNVQFHIRISAELLRRFREVAAKERRNLNDQFEVIFEEWLESRAQQSEKLLGEIEVTDIALDEEGKPIRKLKRKRASGE